MASVTLWKKSINSKNLFLCKTMLLVVLIGSHTHIIPTIIAVCLNTIGYYQYQYLSSSLLWNGKGIDITAKPAQILIYRLFHNLHGKFNILVRCFKTQKNSLISDLFNQFFVYAVYLRAIKYYIIPVWNSYIFYNLMQLHLFFFVLQIISDFILCNCNIGNKFKMNFDAKKFKMLCYVGLFSLFSSNRPEKL